MTDNEIKKALESVAEWFTEHGRNTNTAVIQISRDALDLINRQQAKIERLEDVILTMEDCLYELDYDETAVYCMQNDPEMTKCIKSYVKVEAVEKFVEILKKHIESLEYKANTPRKTITVQMLYDQINWILKKVIPETIDGALKEMVGDAE